ERLRTLAPSTSGKKRSSKAQTIATPLVLALFAKMRGVTRATNTEKAIPIARGGEVDPPPTPDTSGTPGLRARQSIGAQRIGRARRPGVPVIVGGGGGVPHPARRVPALTKVDGGGPLL